MKVAGSILLILIMLSVVVMLLPDTPEGTAFAGDRLYADPRRVSESEGWWDSSGHKVCDENGTYVGEVGEMITLGNMPASVRGTVPATDWFWANTTNPFYSQGSEVEWRSSRWTYPYYPIYNTNQGHMDVTGDVWNYFVGGEMGFLVVIVAVMAVSAVVGLKIFGSGISERSVGIILGGGVFLGLFTVCTVICYDYIVAVPFVGSVVYFLITGLYTIDVVGSLVG